MSRRFAQGMAHFKQFFNDLKNSDNVKSLKKELHGYDFRAINGSVSEKLNTMYTELNSSISITSRIVNEITGYNRIEALKKEILSNEIKLNGLKSNIIQAKTRYQDAINDRNNSQVEINKLLQRKNDWNLQELEQFTNLYKNDHNLQTKENETKLELQKLESKEDEYHNNLINSILNRYHEEQIWSDKIRKISTWGTIIIMAVNVLMLVIVQLLLEPWKRRRMLQKFSDSVNEHLSVLKEEVIANKSTPETDLTSPAEILDGNDLETQVLAETDPETALNKATDLSSEADQDVSLTAKLIRLKDIFLFKTRTLINYIFGTHLDWGFPQISALDIWDPTVAVYCLSGVIVGMLIG